MDKENSNTGSKKRSGSKNGSPVRHDHNTMERHDRGVHFCGHIAHAHVHPIFIDPEEN